jgi:hypothetical protein
MKTSTKTSLVEYATVQAKVYHNNQLNLNNKKDKE